MEWFVFYDPKTKRSLQTHLREFLVFNYLNMHIEETYEIVNTYVRDIEKPDEIVHLFQPTSHDLLCEMYSFVQKEVQSNAMESFIKMMGEGLVLNIEKKEQRATPKQANLIRKLCTEQGIVLDVEVMSLKESRIAIDRLLELSKANKSKWNSPA